MAVPDYQSLMLPLLKLAGDGEEHRLAEAIDTLAQRFHLAEEERKEMLASGTQKKFDNRVSWARTYLKKAGLLQSSGRGTLRITERGLDVLKSDPPEIDSRYLRRYPEFVAFHGSSQRGGKPEANEKIDEPGETPEETLETGYQELRNKLSEELLVQVMECSPRFFEKLVVDLLLAMGYGGSRRDAGQAVGQSGDGGIDGIIKEDRLGLDTVLIQAKRWENSVGRPVVQTFAGSLEGNRARKGVLITTSCFSREAREYVTRIEKRIVLIDGKQLSELMIDHGVGVTEIASYTVKKIDLDYFEDER